MASSRSVIVILTGTRKLLVVQIADISILAFAQFVGRRSVFVVAIIDRSRLLGDINLISMRYWVGHRWHPVDLVACWSATLLSGCAVPRLR
ncbi:hypothetical protein BMW24_015615 [Mycobacterium heckeshornense]|uniref:Uncharacterized protein n=1 Tax=Mycobacterium heckeshornense TaxID=110505 RepID=A0A2G8B613_9MYCO|nr:hypothetical protein ACT16_23075 [Mycobacterium heckeshornense]PIJ33215.1 hypothetical protein BMW24_015615 [Mycobacterium heckeshornense]BCO34948.1 hypothetical protein MHEC_13810 [Mycobacterium heckeshornense]BCQ08113.1 hypothetical protein JMUB5695_01538 [Mycobacterium heckeshornense]